VRLLSRPNRGSRQPGPGVVDAFYEGLDSLKDYNYDYVAKLDADCEFPPDYFSELLAEFQRNPKLGICGGFGYNKTSQGLRKDGHPTHHIRGATKLYRKSCFEDIGGIERALGWDVLDGFKARFKGWDAYTVTSAHFVMNRVAGGVIGVWRRRMHEGRIAYMQHHLLVYLIARSVRRFINKPYVLGGLLIMGGYVAGWWEQLPRVKNQNLIDFLRQEQRDYLWKHSRLKIK
jgi:glycosyltransferase involved in cell wall biosynthesis